MKLKTWLAAIAAAGTLGVMALPAQAASIGGRDVLPGAAAQPSDVQPAHWYGRRRGHGFYHGPRHGYWSYGYRPGFQFYYGPQYHRRHWHHRHHRHW